MFQPPSITRLYEGVTNLRQDYHYYMLGYAITVGIGHFGNRDVAFGGSFQISVIGPDTGGHDHFQLRRLGDALGCHVSGPEWLRDDNLGIVQFAVEHAIGATPDQAYFNPLPLRLAA